MLEIKPLIISRTIPYLGGREIVVDTLIKSLADRGLVCVITPDNYSRRKNVKKYSSDQKWEDILMWTRKQKVTVINCHTFYLSNLAFYLSKELKVPLVFTLHGVFIDFYGKKYGAILKRIYTKSDLVITVSDNYRKTLGKYIGDSSKLVTIKNGIDLDIIDKIKIKTPSYYRHKNNLSEDKFVVLVPARLTFLKGLDYMIEAANNVKDKDILFVVCSPSGRMNPEEVAYQKKLKKSVSHHNSNVKF